MTDAGVKSIDELRAFAIYLRNLNQSMIGEFDHARREMYRINEGWNDRENERFMAEFEQSVAIINRIAEQMEAYSVFIHKKSDILEQYINTSL